MERIIATKARPGGGQAEAGMDGKSTDAGASAGEAATPTRASADQLETLLKLVEELHEGSFVPLSQQPPIRALLLPLGGLGWAALLDFRLLPGL